jgi:hypothetical protein
MLKVSMGKVDLAQLKDLPSLIELETLDLFPVPLYPQECLTSLEKLTVSELSDQVAPTLLEALEGAPKLKYLNIAFDSKDT